MEFANYAAVLPSIQARTYALYALNAMLILVCYRNGRVSLSDA